MEFKVYTDSTGSFDSYSGSDTCWRYRGMLVVTADDGAREIVYGPNGWIRVESVAEPIGSMAFCEVEVSGPQDVLSPNPVSVVVENIEYARSRPPM
jgi:hypothetical protein